MRWVCALLVLLWLSSRTGVATAAPVTFEFQYTFFNGHSLSGVLRGELQPDQDTVLVTEILNANYSLDPGTNFQTELQTYASLASISGVEMRLITVDPAAGSPAFWLDSGSEGGAAKIGVFNEDFGRGLDLVNEAYLPSNWSMVPAAVPVPAAAWLFGSAVLCLGVSRRRSSA
jgi:hypothetical protein